MVAAFAAAVAACDMPVEADTTDDVSAEQASLVGMCLDRNDIRIEDNRCPDPDDEGFSMTPTGEHYIWIPTNYNNGNYAIPPTGSYAYQFIGKDKAMTKVPNGTPLAKGLPSKGAPKMNGVQRGGLGIAGKAGLGKSGGS
jgi:hypothetical protein